jgi:hypothetical protein
LRRFRVQAGRVALAAALAVSVGQASSFERTLTLDAFGPRIEAGGEGFVVEWERGYVDGAAGHPAIPWLPYRVALPAGERILSVDLVPLEERVLGPGIVVQPIPELTAERSLVPHDPDPDAYQSTAWGPGSRARFAESGFYEGYRVVGLSLAPVQYLPIEGRLRIADRFRVRITTAPAAALPAAARRLRSAPGGEARARERIASRVDWLIGAEPAGAGVSSDPLSRERAFVPTDFPSLEGSGVDLVIVTSEALADSFQMLADWHTRTGLRSVVRTVEWITANYEAPDEAARVRRFLQDAYVYWGITYAVLGGDSDVVPVRYARSYYQNPEGVNLLTDYYFACLQGDWNADGDHLVGEAPSGGEPGDETDLEPDIYVGRLTASTPEEAGVLARKTMWYEGSDPDHFDDSYQVSASFWAEVLFPLRWEGDCNDMEYDGARIAQQLIERTFPASLIAQTRTLLEAHTCPRNQPPDFPVTPLPESIDAVMADLDEGRHFVTHVGHGSWNNLSVGGSDKVLAAQASAAANGDRTSVLYAINCNSGQFDFDSVSEFFLLNNRTNGNGGAVAVVAATDLDYPYTSGAFTEKYFELVLGDSLTRIGDAFLEANRIVGAAQAADADNGMRWMVFTLVLLADPAVDLWTAEPAYLVTDASQFVMGSGPYTVTVFDRDTFLEVEGALVTLFKEGEIFDTELTDASGVATFDFVPSTAGPFTVGARRHNYVPSVETRDAAAPAGSPYLVVESAAVSDAASGNGNGSADRGETFSLTLTIGNAGGANATGVTLNASTSSPFVNITQPSANVGLVPAHGSAVAGAIELTASALLPDTLAFVDVPIEVQLAADQGNADRSYALRVGTPLIAHIGLTTEEIGDGDGVLEGGESARLFARAWNDGLGALINGRVRLVAVDPDSAAVTTDEAAVDPLPGNVAVSGELAVDVLGPGGLLFDLSYLDDAGTLLTRRVDLAAPAPPDSLWSDAGPNVVRVNWVGSADADVLGYNVYQEQVSARGALVKLNTTPVRGGYFASLGLPDLTAFHFTVTAVDSSGNESAFSDTILAASAPPFTGGWPLRVEGIENRSSVTIADLDQDGLTHEMLVGADFLYVVRGDGTEFYDGDGAPATIGIFSTSGHIEGSDFQFWGKPAAADLDADGDYEVVATHFGDPFGSGPPGRVLVWEHTGALRWSRDVGDFLWSSPAVGNIDNDPQSEIVFWAGEPTGAFEGSIVAFNHDGSEVFDGDGNGATVGVFWKSGVGSSAYNYSSVALWDFDIDGRDEIVAAERHGASGVVHLLDFDPVGQVVSELPGWPYQPPVGPDESHFFTSSPAVADVDDTPEYEVFVTSKHALFGLRANGSLLPGYPKYYEASTSPEFLDLVPSPAIGEIDGDGLLDVVQPWKDGLIYAYTASTGAPLAGWPVQLATVGPTFARSLFNCSLSNVDSDPEAEVVVGTGKGEIYCLNGDGSIVGGFPYPFGGIVRGAPAVWDIDRNHATDIVMIGQTSSLIASLELTGVVNFTETNPWPQFRHDSRNSGVYGSGRETPIDIGSVEIVSPSAGRVEIRWTAPGQFLTFDIERAVGEETPRRIGTVPADEDARYAYVDASAPSGRVARYWIVGRTPSHTERVGPLLVNVASRQLVNRLFQNAPNPFNPRTSFTYEVGESSGGSGKVPVRLEIFDVRGRLVATVVDGSHAPGRYVVGWDGRDAAGHDLGSGSFVYRLAVGDESFSRKLVLTR